MLRVSVVWLLAGLVALALVCGCEAKVRPRQEKDVIMGAVLHVSTATSPAYTWR